MESNLSSIIGEDQKWPKIATLGKTKLGRTSVQVLSNGDKGKIKASELEGMALIEGDTVPVVETNSLFGPKYSFIEGCKQVFQALIQLKDRAKPVIALPRRIKPGGLEVSINGLSAFLSGNAKEIADLCIANSPIPVMIDGLDENFLGKPQGVIVRKIEIQDDEDSEDAESNYYVLDKGYSCKVRKIEENGAVVDFGDNACWLPNEEISWSGISNAEDTLTKGTKISCHFLPYKGDGIIYVSKRIVEPNPWSQGETDNEGEKHLKTIAKGDIRSGIIREIGKGGTLIDLGDFSAYVPTEDISWPGVYPPENWEVGSPVEIKVNKIDFRKQELIGEPAEKGEDPWLSEERTAGGRRLLSRFYTGMHLRGKVVKYRRSGADINLNGIKCSVSPMPERNDDRYPPHEEGDKVLVSVGRIDWENRRVFLKLLTLEEVEEWNKERAEFREKKRAQGRIKQENFGRPDRIIRGNPNLDVSIEKHSDSEEPALKKMEATSQKDNGGVAKKDEEDNKDNGDGNNKSNGVRKVVVG